MIDNSVSIYHKGKEILIDVNDFHILCEHSWCIANQHHTSYVNVYINTRNVPRLHRYLFPKRKTSSSFYKGVRKYSQNPLMWRACVCKDYNWLNLLTSTNEHECAFAYNIASELLTGEFGIRNEIKEIISHERQQFIKYKVIKYLKEKEVI